MLNELSKHYSFSLVLGVALFGIATPSFAQKQKTPSIEQEISPGKPMVVSIVKGMIGPANNALPTLVGPSAQIYVPLSDGSGWKRKGSGGVSTDVLGVYQNSENELFAIGKTAPLFKQVNGSWFAYPHRIKGKVRAASGKALIISIGRHIFHLNGKSWFRVAVARGKINSLYASDANHYIVSTQKKGLFRGGKTSWSRIALRLVHGDSVRGIVGSKQSKQKTILFTNKHHIYELGKKQARKVALPVEFQHLSIHSAGIYKGEVLFVGEIDAVKSGIKTERKLITFTLQNSKPVIMEKLKDLPSGDRFSFVTSNPAGMLFLGSNRGVFRIRSLDGMWKTASFSSIPPAPKEDFSHGKPAHAF